MARHVVFALISFLVLTCKTAAQSPAAKPHLFYLHQNQMNGVSFARGLGVFEYEDDRGNTIRLYIQTWHAYSMYGTDDITWFLGVSDTPNGKFVTLPKAILEEIGKARDPKDPDEGEKETGKRWEVVQGPTDIYKIHTNHNWRKQCTQDTDDSSKLTCDADVILLPTIDRFRKFPFVKMWELRMWEIEDSLPRQAPVSTAPQTDR